MKGADGATRTVPPTDLTPPSPKPRPSLIDLTGFELESSDPLCNLEHSHQLGRNTTRLGALMSRAQTSLSACLSLHSTARFQLFHLHLGPQFTRCRSAQTCPASHGSPKSIAISCTYFSFLSCYSQSTIPCTHECAQSCFRAVCAHALTAII